MYSNNKVLAIIPAREGSKRIPGKNYKQLNGRPLIEWTIIAAQQSKFIDDILVSSDDSKILEIAKKNNVIDYQREKKLSADNTSSIDVVIDVINNVKKNYNLVMLLQPTSPLRQSNDMDSAIELFYYKNADSVISVCESDHPVQWMNYLPEDLSLVNFISKDILSTRSQDLEKSYCLNGALYLIKPEILKEKRTFFLEKNVYAYKMPRNRSIDIDEEIDFQLAEIIFNEKEK